MNKKLISILVAAGLLISSVAFAQLVGVQRIKQSFWFLDDKQIQMGNKPDAACEYDTAQTNDALVCGLSTDSNRLIITEYGDMNSNFALTKSTNPAISIVSADKARTLSLYNDGTDGVFDVSAGSIKFLDAVTLSGGLTGLTSLDLGDGNLTNVGNVQLDSLEADAAAGTIVMKGATAGTNKESLTWDFETTPNQVGISTTTGVSNIETGTMKITANGLDAKDSDISNVGVINLDRVQSDDVSGVVTFSGAPAGTNKEDLVWNFEANPNTVGVSSTTGVTKLNFNGLNVGTNGIELNGFDVGNVNSLFSTNSGAITMKGNPGGTNKEDLIYNFETVANQVGVSSTTGVNTVLYNGMTLKAHQLNSDTGAANLQIYNVDEIQLPQVDVGVNCNQNQIAFDTGGATPEICFCSAPNTWRCVVTTAGPTD
jgi:hypothetical protein